MAQAVLRVEPLPASSLDAAATFHADWLPRARALLRNPPRPGEGEDLVLVFPPADYSHRAWRLAAVQDLAREAVPNRVNAVAGDNEQAIGETAAWLASAPGITGQLLTVSRG